LNDKYFNDMTTGKVTVGMVWAAGRVRDYQWALVILKTNANIEQGISNTECRSVVRCESTNMVLWVRDEIRNTVFR
jgi:hypothetical protein